jgi:hypothetical protein
MSNASSHFTLAYGPLVPAHHKGKPDINKAREAGMLKHKTLTMWLHPDLLIFSI